MEHQEETTPNGYRVSYNIPGMHPFSVRIENFSTIENKMQYIEIDGSIPFKIQIPPSRWKEFFFPQPPQSPFPATDPKVPDFPETNVNNPISYSP